MVDGLKEVSEVEKEKKEEVDLFQCPRCNSRFGYTNKDGTRVCRNCSHRYKL